MSNFDSGYDSGWRNQPTLSQATYTTFVNYYLTAIAEICTLAAAKYIVLTVICIAAHTGGKSIDHRVYTACGGIYVHEK
ncbi:hypothetical protein [Snodgrassella gandavensis]|uniref:hypothetical protein n=1 Tax=Snodgrassella gandavensis TaxID=2946698 RepID=UPI001EF4AB55|nr:hypothetical protein [Snodgrassella gandavensis]